MELPLALLSLFLGTAPVEPVILWATDSGIPRADHGAALLPDGRVMVMGYQTFREQLYDPAADTWSDGGTGLDQHAIFSTARTRNGTLVIVDNSPTYEWWSPWLPDWEVAPTGADRQQGVAVLLPSGKVLTGCGDDGTNPIGNFETLDEDAGIWVDAGIQLVPTSLCALSPLPGDRWLKTGGVFAASTVAELWSPDGGRAMALQSPRQEHASVVLPDGRVLVTGGNDSPVPDEIFDPVTEQWDAGATPSVERFRASATVLPDGRVLVAGGFDGANVALDTGEIFDPATGLWSPPFQLGLRRGAHVGLMLPSGRVFLTGGDDNVDATSSSQLLDFSSPFVSGGPARPAPVTAPRLGTARGTPILWDDQGPAAYRMDSQGMWVALPPAPPNHGAVAVALRDGRLLRVGASIDGYDPDRDAWFTVPGAPDGGRPGAAAALLGTGEVLIAGGNGPSALVQRFDPRTAAWTQTEDLPRAANDGQAISLRGGDVMVCGGDTAVGVTDWCWLYTTSTSHWTFGVRFFAPRRRFSLTGLESGRVLAAGGENDAGLVASAEVFNPSSVSWVSAAPLLQARSGHAAVRLRNGQVLVMGGAGGPGALDTTELFDPLPRSFSAGPSLGGPRVAPVAMMAESGQVLIGGAEGGPFEVFDEGRGAQDQWLPALGTPPRGGAGQAVTVPGAQLTGVTPGSSGDMRSSPSDLPVLALVGPDDLLVRPGALGWTPSSVTFQVPPTASGWYAMSASVNGIESNAQSFIVGRDVGQACDAGADCAAGICGAGSCAAPPEIIVVPPDAGTDAGADAGTDAGADAGNDGGADAGSPSALGVGCGCTAAPGAWAALLIVVFALRARVRRVRPRG